jgi:hypothetical protein
LAIPNANIVILDDDVMGAFGVIKSGFQTGAQKAGITPSCHCYPNQSCGHLIGRIARGLAKVPAFFWFEEIVDSAIGFPEIVECLGGSLSQTCLEL